MILRPRTFFHLSFVHISRTRKNNRGFTLLEILCSVAIVGTTLVASLETATQALHTGARTQRTARATSLAQNELEFWKAQSPAKMKALDEGEHAFANPLAETPENGGTSSTLTSRLVGNGLAELAATVEIQAEPNRPVRVTLTTWLPTEAAK